MCPTPAAPSSVSRGRAWQASGADTPGDKGRHSNSRAFVNDPWLTPPQATPKEGVAECELKVSILLCCVTWYDYLLSLFAFGLWNLVDQFSPAIALIRASGIQHIGSREGKTLILEQVLALNYLKHNNTYFLLLFTSGQFRTKGYLQFPIESSIVAATTFAPVSFITPWRLCKNQNHQCNQEYRT